MLIRKVINHVMAKLLEAFSKRNYQDNGKNLPTWQLASYQPYHGRTTKTFYEEVIK
jgi:hypothetical protein